MTEFATRAVHAGLEPDPSYGSVVPAIHQASTYVQPRPGEFDWAEIFQGASAFHISGITPAVSEGARAAKARYA